MAGAQARLVGRDEELTAVAAFFEAERPPGVLLVEGEAGIGKTTLWEQALQEAGRRHYLTLSCRPSGTEAELSYSALGDLLEHVLDDVLPELPPPQRRALEAALLLQDPGEGRLDRRGVAVAFLTVLRRLEAAEPVAVAVDDLHWLDPETSSTLEFAARRLGERRITLILARRARPNEAPPLGLGRTPVAEQLQRIWLGGLSLGAVHHLLQTRLGVMLPRPRLRRLHELSGGNPFYALELGRAFETDAISLEPGEPLPSALNEIVSHRLAGLPVATQTALATAAALSRPTTDHVDVDALAPAVDADVVQISNGEVRFAHPLLRAAAYALVSEAERRALHRRLADVVDEVEERARHLALASAEPDPDLASIVEAGAVEAFRRGAPSAAAELAEQARRLTLAEAGADALRRGMEEAEYRFEAGDVERAGSLLEELAQSAPAGPERARLLSRLARVRHFGADVGGGVALLREASGQAGDDLALRAEIEEGLAWGLVLMRDDLDAAAEHARSAVRLAEQVGDAAALAEGLAAQALTELAVGEDPTTAIERALALEPSTLHLRVLRHPSFAHGYLLSCSDELEPARRVFRELERRALEQGDESALPPILNHLTLVECLAGNWQEATSNAEEGYSLALQGGQEPTQASILGKTALVEVLRGNEDDARDKAARSLAIADPHFDPSRPNAALSRGGETAIWALGLLELSPGQAKEACRYLGPLSSVLIEAGIRDPGELRCLPDLVESLVSLGRLEEAEELLIPFEETARRLDRPSALALAGRCRGLLLAGRGDLTEALTVLEGALKEHDRRAIPFERARTLLTLGQVQRRAKRRRNARASLERALTSLEQLGARVWAERARMELARVGGRAAAKGDLTPSERRLAELVAEGRSNKEVAAALFVTPKTVETKLSRLYAKLGIHSRGELARRVLERKRGNVGSAPDA
jgi:DNA-binding CsgD family transcriptional regulator